MKITVSYTRRVTRGENTRTGCAEVLDDEDARKFSFCKDKSVLFVTCFFLGLHQRTRERADRLVVRQYRGISLVEQTCDGVDKATGKRFFSFSHSIHRDPV